MGPRKQVIKDATSKGKANETDGGIVPPLTGDQPHITEDTCSSSRQERVANIQPLQQRGDQLFQTLYKMKEQMKEKQAQPDHEWKQMDLDRENILQKQEKLKLLN